MECPDCGADNGASRKFCRACGTALAPTCPACHARNGPGDCFCGECGVPLAPTGGTDRRALAGTQERVPRNLATPSQAASALVDAAPANIEERRLVTVLFADFVGFTALAERLDPEDVREITTACFRRLVAVVTRYGGTIDKFIGDSVMALFGAPVAHEDDPARALHAALGLQQALAAFNRDLKRERGLLLALRIGIETGEVVVGTREIGEVLEYTAIGDAVNVAARLQAAAEPDTALIGEATLRLTHDTFVLRAVEPLTLRGRTRPVAAAVLTGVRSAPAHAIYRAPLVGRSDELRTLLHCLDAVRLGAGQIVAVVGEPGLGKSRLLAELHDRAERSADRDEPPVNWVQCAAFSHEQAQSYGLIHTLVNQVCPAATTPDEDLSGRLRRALARIVDGQAVGGQAVDGQAVDGQAVDGQAVDGRAVDGQAVDGRAVGGQAVGARRATALIRLLGLSTPHDMDALKDREPRADASPREVQQLALAALAGLVTRQTSDGPLVVTLDDLHWADPSSVDMLGELVDAIGQAPVVWCWTFRPERAAPIWALHERLSERGTCRYVTIVLQPLAPADSVDLVRRLLQIDGLPPGLDVLVERASGTPLWVEELVQTLVERGLIVRSGDNWRITADLRHVDLPSSLQALIVARIDRLGAARRTVQTASVIGRRFGRGVLDRITDERHLDEHLHLAQQSDLVQELAGTTEREYSFKHALTQEAAYATLLMRRRRALHRRVAETMEALYPDRLGELRAVLAHHYARAGQWDKVVEHASAGAEAARVSYANREAIELYSQALDASERFDLPTRQRLALLEGRAEAHAVLGAFEPARADFERALTLAEEIDDPVARIRVLGALGTLWGGHQDYQQGVDLTRRAAAVADAYGDRRAVAEARLRLGIMLLNQARMDETRTEVEAALRLFRDLDDGGGIARSLDALGMACCLVCSFDLMVAYSLEAADRLQTLGDRATAASATIAVGLGLGYGGQRAESEVWLRRGLDAVTEIGARGGEAYAWMVHAQILEQYGAYEVSRQAARTGLSIAREVEHREWTIACLAFLGRIHRRCGDLATARRLHDEAADITRTLGTELWIGLILAELGLDVGLSGDDASARQSIDEAEQAGTAMTFFLPYALAARAELALRASRLDEVVETAARLRSRVPQARVFVADARRAEGEALAGLGRLAEAQRTLRTAKADAVAIGAAPVQWGSCLALADLLARSNRPEEAAAERAEALTLLVSVRDSLTDDRLRACFDASEPMRRARGARHEASSRSAHIVDADVG
ncbi:MAG: AAA family ATPase [Chloroflexi bacterium]|nr:AAA family ATPase [Chloroflexota bacterium]